MHRGLLGSQRAEHLPRSVGYGEAPPAGFLLDEPHRGRVLADDRRPAVVVHVLMLVERAQAGELPAARIALASGHATASLFRLQAGIPSSAALVTAIRVAGFTASASAAS